MIFKLRLLLSQYAEKSWVFADQALVSGVNFSVGIMLARWLGLEAYGLFALGWMFVLFASGLQQSFIIAPLYALTARQVDQINWLNGLKLIQFIFSLLCLPFSVAIIEISFLMRPDWRVEGISFVVALIVGIYTMNDFFRRVLFLKSRGRKVFEMDVLGFGMQVILLVLFELLGQLSLFSAFLSILLAQSLSLLFYLLTVKSSIKTSKVVETLQTTWKYSRFLIATSVLQWSSGNYFILVAGGLLGPAAVGVVRIVQNLMGLLHVVFLALENIIPARAAEILNSEGVKALYHYLKRASSLLIIPILAVLAILISFHQEIIHLFYGEMREDVGQVLVAFSFVYLMVFVGTMFRFAIRTLEKNQLIFKSYLLTTAFSLALAHPFVSKFGVMGVVAGLAGTQLISLIYFYVTLKRAFKWTGT
ncbi:MAG: oligosaccharide flippase family protein [Flavobacteriales bacterium]|nr:oligosaccharide flippase family protein [Flavobacteriales bacterium]